MRTIRLVSVVDDSESVRESLPDLPSQFRHDAEVFPSAESFLASSDVSGRDCLILDRIARNERSRAATGVAAAGVRDPRRVNYGPGRCGALARLVANGAADVLYKPFSDTTLLDRLTFAFATP